MPMLSVGSARHIAEDLEKNVNVVKCVKELLKKRVTVKLLRNIELEKALAIHAWHPRLCDKVQFLLIKYFRMLRRDDEARERKIKEEEAAKIEAAMAVLPVIEKENEPKKTVPKLVIKLPGRGHVQPQKADDEVQVTMVVKSANSKNANKRRNDSEIVQEPLRKRIKKYELKKVDTVRCEENTFPGEEKKTENANEDPKKIVGKEDARLAKFDMISQKKPVKSKKTMEVTKDAKKVNEDKGKAIMRLVKKINKLPGLLTPSDIDDFQKGVAACDLQEAEKRLGRNLKRLDRVWWFLLERDFKISRDNAVCDPRAKYFKQLDDLIDSLFD